MLGRINTRALKVSGTASEGRWAMSGLESGGATSLRSTYIFSGLSIPLCAPFLARDTLMMILQGLITAMGQRIIHLDLHAYRQPSKPSNRSSTSPLPHAKSE